ncbi:MAG: 6-phosphogluconolactonase, partial [Acidobacteriaceae bacterium]|nr:6-phosphogluconolactonase [Acidobacteriaceae bacterium]
MKFSKFGRIALASVVSLGLGFGVIACGPSNTLDFVYVTSSKLDPGQINVYKVDSQAGALIPIPNSPYNSGGTNPVADVASAGFVGGPAPSSVSVLPHFEQNIAPARLLAPHEGQRPGRAA